ncbi:hypothetical protein COCC4DRAFT_55062 [Bipolaris maydis ATCC 48331]|uniref:Uncharacterized protein n=2 Tax=Cochliobolus heterostrophus TaxID=5016 RepID=M2UAB3_COCH5|nr:uncharacterized protein COCC4DRAFT_55062 [Bipolaris maydis ATCC 48331]EMD95534.1 hypothetical protein COCHEDRAFT_1026399 [Bipolaris maydis C5]ENI10398.1 hypothetical protein COCC4DRAFT_55062 [Bipolaris maydis ATCC 48331]
MTVPEASRPVELRADIHTHVELRPQGKYDVDSVESIEPWYPGRRRQMLRARALISRRLQSPEIGRASRARHLTGSATNPPGCLQHGLAAISLCATIGSRRSDEMPFRPSGPNPGTKQE